MTIKISQLTSLATVYGNVLIPVVSNIAGILTTVSSNVDQLTTFILGTVASDLANLTALTTANAEIQSGQISTLTANASSQHGQLIALTANAANQHDAIITSNVNLTGYADAITSAWTANAATQLDAIITSNVNLTGYADAITSAWTANAATQLGDITTLYANASTQLESITALEGNVSITQGNIITLTQGLVAGGSQITGLLNGFANVLTYTNATISSNSSAGLKGDTAYDNNYIYFCVATDSWIRATRDVW
jgi:hypothetical protein